jgi:hypothetical protein
MLNNLSFKKYQVAVSKRMIEQQGINKGARVMVFWFVPNADNTDATCQETAEARITAFSKSQFLDLEFINGEGGSYRNVLIKRSPKSEIYPWVYKFANAGDIVWEDEDSGDCIILKVMKEV